MKIAHAVRLQNSNSGNPRYRVTFDNGSTYETAADADCNYSVQNFVNSGEQVEFILGAQGRITHITGKGNAS